MRIRLLCLWVHLLTRLVADGFFLFLVSQKWAQQLPNSSFNSWFLAAVFIGFPILVLAPVGSALAQRFYARWVLFTTSTLALVAFVSAGKGPIIEFWIVSTVTLVVSLPTFKEQFWLGTRKGQVLFLRENAWLLAGSVAAYLSGLAFARYAMTTELEDFTLILILTLAYVLSMLSAMAVDFGSTQAPTNTSEESSLSGTVGRILRDRELCPLFLAPAILSGLLLGTSAVLISAQDNSMVWRSSLFIHWACWVGGGFVASALFLGWWWQPRRALGWVVIGAVGLFVTMFLSVWSGKTGTGIGMTLGICAGAAIVPLRSVGQAYLSPKERCDGLAIQDVLTALFVLVTLGIVFILHSFFGWSFDALLLLFLVLSVFTMVWLFLNYYRELVEILLETITCPFYRLRRHGPGRWTMPWTGSVIVIANHAALIDPLMLARAVPNRTIFMMTSSFYDLPLVKPLFKYIARAIRVQDSTFRREVPELKEAAKTLQQGECLVIFPEGRLRRKEEKPLQQFGQGVWFLLNECPETPVVTCWIEGTWGSYSSYEHGPPTKNKSLDVLRRIDVAIHDPVVIDKEMLKDRKALRKFLMERCLQTREFIRGAKPFPSETDAPKTATEEAITDTSDEEKPAEKSNDPTSGEPEG